MSKSRVMADAHEDQGLVQTDLDESHIVQSQLNDLITMNRGIIEVYQTAAKRLKDESYVEIMNEYAEQHETFVTELTESVVSYSASPATTQSGSSVVKQAWVTLKAALTEGDGPILSEVAEDAKKILDGYGDAMSADLPDDVRDLLRDHLTMARIHHEKLEALAAIEND